MKQGFMELRIIPWTRGHEAGVIELILSIQRNEFHISITEADQPDLKQVEEFYMQGNGNFWIALCQNQVVGTIALLDIGNHQVALRKMFVHKDFRGSLHSLANKLLLTAIDWCMERNIQDIYLGTVEVLKAAHRFYEKNGFNRIEKTQLPSNFPVMGVDTLFYHLSISR
jgi:N-acetylglutamate synthase-like GNAT family acetyltransferase